MARIRSKATSWAEKWEPDNYKDYRRGALEDEFWDEDELVDYRHPPRKKKKPSRRSQSLKCTSDYHEFEWQPYTRLTTYAFFAFFGYHREEAYTCKHCSRTKRYRYTEKYEATRAKRYSATYGDEFTVKRGEPISRRRSYKAAYRYWRWEDYDLDYQAWLVEEGEKRQAKKEAEEKWRNWLLNRIG